MIFRKVKSWIFRDVMQLKFVVTDVSVAENFETSYPRNIPKQQNPQQILTSTEFFNIIWQPVNAHPFHLSAAHGISVHAIYLSLTPICAAFFSIDGHLPTVLR